MNRELFADYLKAPEKISREGVAAFEAVISEYPFCQPAQLLYVKGLQNTEDVRFNRQLKIAAAYAADRRMLFELLNPPQAGDFATEAGIPEAAVADYELAPPEGGPERIEPAEAEYDKPGLVHQVEELLPIADLDLLIFDFPAYRQDDLPDLPFEKLVPDAPEVNGPDEELLRGFLEADPLSRLLSARPEVHSMHVSPGYAEGSQRLTRKPADELIDRFIENPGPRIVPPEKPIIVDNDISESSLREDDDLLTETLAKIYVQQGYLQKAIQAYEKLSLKFPEKSIYFASQIETVKELIKNQ